MRPAIYARYELLRTFRNRRFLLFSLGFPLVLFFVIAAPNRHVQDLGGSGIPAALYFMVSLAALGAMNAVTGTGARISVERTVGWTRQLRLTPLSSRAYFASKLAVAYSTALLTIGVLYAAGTSLGVSLSATSWLEMTALLLVGLLPFAALGVVIGHLVGADAIGPAMGGITALLGLLGGVWFPVGSGALGTIAHALPSYWLVQASRAAIGGHSWGVTGWLVVAGWTLALGLLAAYAYRRDTART
jgi:ABC-2 type transport system permease protein